VQASREWICVRPATYESAAEAKILSRWFSGRDGDLENTTFALLDPSGERALARAGRGPEMVYAGSKDFAAALRQLAGDFEAKEGTAKLPMVADLRLGLNVAASDGLPLVVIVAAAKAKREALMQQLEQARSEGRFTGQAHFVVLETAQLIHKMEGYKAEASLHVLQPDTFGRSAEIVAAFAAAEKKLATKLAITLKAARIDKAGHRDHVRQGKRAGVSWKSAIPVSDVSARRERQD